MSATCEHWIGAERRYCGATENVHRHLNSTVCPRHTPAALAGKPEPGVRAAVDHRKDTR